MQMRRIAVTALALMFLAAAPAFSQTLPLETGWQFAADPGGHATVADVQAAESQLQWREVRVGLSWNAQFEDLRDYLGVAWYRTTMEVPLFDPPQRVLLRFGAVDYACEVFVNGQSVGTHEGGYTPFVYDVTALVHPGANRIAVRVVDPPMKDTANQFGGMRYNELPHGKQHWYVQTGGIWQPVQVEFRPATFIERVQVAPQLEGDVTLHVKLEGGQTGAVAFTIRDATGRSVAAGAGPVAGGEALLQARVPDPQWWSPESPSLYTVEVTLDPGGDLRRERFGFRRLEAKDGKLYLNGQPFYMLAALDQDFYPETIYTPPSRQYVREQMLQGRRLGLNTLRCHIKVCDPTYLDAADEAGMLVWYEIPSWNDGRLFTAAAARRAETILDGMIERDWNHPSIVIQSIINEAWGTDLKQAEQRRWLRAMYGRAKQATAGLGRLIVDNSACCQNFHVQSDLDDFHQYFSIPDNAGKWAQWTAEFAARPPWSFSPYGDAERSGAEPLIVSEFGNWGLPRLPLELPWWFGRDFGGRAVTRPAGLFDRFRDYNFARLYPTYGDLAEASQWHQFESLKYEIEDLRGHGSIQGYVITEFTDINWEANGLMDMWRHPKAYAARLAQIQQPDVVLARLAQRNYVSGERVELQVTGSHYGPADWSGARVRWATQSGAAGEFALAQAPARGTVAPLNTISFRAPAVDAARKEWISLQVVSAAGDVLCANLYDVFVYPATKPRRIEIAIHDPAHSLSGLTQALRTAGYKVGARQNTNVLLLASVLDAVVEEHLRAGGRALLLLDSADALPKTSAIAVKAREGSDLDGNWVTNFNWARTDADPFRAVAFGKILGFEAAAVTPRYVLQNVPAAAYDDVLAGVFYGWLNNNGALALQAKHGSGSLLATTFRFADYASDAYARNLLDGMISYVTGAAFRPKVAWNAAPEQAATF
jgi:hypothetical protein